MNIETIAQLYIKSSSLEEAVTNNTKRSSRRLLQTVNHNYELNVGSFDNDIIDDYNITTGRDHTHIIKGDYTLDVKGKASITYNSDYLFNILGNNYNTIIR